jgi:DNA-binding response OmpR family regulator
MTPSILVIEDDADLRAEICEYLERRHNRVYGCGTLAEGRQALAERQPDIVMADIHLPDGDGDKFCIANAAKTPQTRWLLLSGDSDRVRQSRQLLRAPDAPPFSVLDKPFALHLLAEFVRLSMMGKAMMDKQAPNAA